MQRTPEHRARLFAALQWVPILVYFVVKYLIFGNEMSRPQWIGLIAAVILAEIALWLYRRKQIKNQGSPDGTNE